MWVVKYTEIAQLRNPKKRIRVKTKNSRLMAYFLFFNTHYINLNTHYISMM